LNHAVEQWDDVEYVYLGIERDVFFEMGWVVCSCEEIFMCVGLGVGDCFGGF